MGNYYTTTIHSISAAVVKLGKLEQARTLYRAPGGALPKTFWRSPRGGIEPAFMSTSTDREAAMGYARRSPSRILFEIEQGLVARGASIQWLSQYPEEAELLFPPLTVLEVKDVSVEGSVVIAKIAPSVPAQAKVGSEDERLAWEERKRLIAQAQEATAAAEATRLEEERLRHQAEKLKWAKSMSQVMASAKKVEAAALKNSVAKAARAEAQKSREASEALQKVAEEQLKMQQASEEAQRMLDEANKEQQTLIHRLKRTQTGLAERGLQAQLAKQASSLAGGFAMKMKEKKHALEMAKMQAEAEKAAAAQAGRASEAAAEAAYAKAQAEFEEAARLADEEAERMMAMYKERALPIIKREELETQVKALSTTDLVERLRVAVSSRQSDAAEVCAARLQEITKAKPTPGQGNSRADVVKAGGLSVLSACISYVIDQASETGGGHPGKMLDDCCEALGCVLKQPGVEATAIEAGVLKALSKTLNQTMRSGLAAVEAICKGADESVRKQAAKEGIQPEWMDPPKSKKK